MKSRKLVVLAAWPVLGGCSPLLGLDQDFYVTPGGSAGAASGGVAGSSGSGGAAGSSGSGGVAGSEAEGGTAPVELPETLPAGLIAYHRYTTYGNGDAETFLVDLPSGAISAELGKLYQLCGPLSPSFSPDGTRLAVSARPWANPCPTGDAHRSELEIYVLNIEDLSRPSKLRVTQNTVPDEDPSFSTSGDFLLVKHDDDIAKFVLDEAVMPYTDCDKLSPPSYCFKRDKEQLKPVMSADGLVFFQQGTQANADIFYFDLAQAETTLTMAATPAAARADAYEARPSIFGPWLYFAQWRTKAEMADRIVRKPLSALKDNETPSTFEDNPLNDYTDPGGLSGDLVLFASEEGAGGGHDLFVGDFVAGWRSTLDHWIPGINSTEDELSPTFWPRPVP